MANQEQLAILKQGVEVWNQWRKDHVDIQPDLSRAALFQTDLSHANLHEADLSHAALSGANLAEADLSHANLQGADLSHANLIGANLSKAELREATLSFATLIGAELQGADLSHANLNVTTLSKANLSRANIRSAHLYKADLSHALLSGAGLAEAELKEANLQGADLSHANLIGAELQGADLHEANLSDAKLQGADLHEANLSDANLQGADLERAVLVETNLTGANLTQCFVYGISVWSVQLEGTKQDSLVITRYNEPIIKVDNLEVAQFIYLLLNYKKLRDILNAVTERGVLLLGRFGGGGLEVLQAIAVKLREENYLPIIFDFERPQDRDYTETVKTLAGLSRFVIVDLSGPSVPQELSHIVPFFDIPFVPIIEKGRSSYAMFKDLFKYPWVLRPLIEFATVEDLLERMPAEVIAPAEEKHKARQKLLDELFKKA